MTKLQDLEIRPAAIYRLMECGCQTLNMTDPETERIVEILLHKFYPLQLQQYRHLRPLSAAAAIASKQEVYV